MLWSTWPSSFRIPSVFKTICTSNVSGKVTLKPMRKTIKKTKKYEWWMLIVMMTCVNFHINVSIVSLQWIDFKFADGLSYLFLLCNIKSLAISIQYTLGPRCTMLQPILHHLNSTRIVLASSSPRRKQILENIVIIHHFHTVSYTSNLCMHSTVFVLFHGILYSFTHLVSNILKLFINIDNMIHICLYFSES